MSSAPVWVTEAGSLGVVPEGKYYRLALTAIDPDPALTSADSDLVTTDNTLLTADSSSDLTYSLIAGELPEGVQVSLNGIVDGIPVSVADFKGVPSEVSENTTSKFVIRVTDSEGRIADRTFTLTVSGQDKPEWITPSGPIANPDLIDGPLWSDATAISFQFDYVDLDPGDELEVTLIAGDLPQGLELSTSGLLHGFVPAVFSAGAGGNLYDGDPYDEFPFDATLGSIDQNYQFTLKLTDGKDIVLRTFEMLINGSPIRTPYIVNHTDSIGVVRHDNFFAYKFEGRDPDGFQINYYFDPESITADSIIFKADSNIITVDAENAAGLTLDTETGWLYGYLPVITQAEETFNFGIRVFRVLDPVTESELYETSITLYGDIDTNASWITDADLGIIDNGDFSTFNIEAQYEGAVLEYALPVGELLPPGLTLLPSGAIIGQVDFNTFNLDTCTTTFDSEYGTSLSLDPTTFDLTYTFNAEAFSVSGPAVSVFKEFTILINAEYCQPYNTLFCKATPPRADRALLDTLLLNETVIPPEIIYRADDPNFGSATQVIYNHAYGLSPATILEYFESLELNHYNKNLVLGEIKTARALDANDNVLYEVVYSEVQDDLVNQEGVSIPRSVPIKYPALHNGSPTSTVYPNSLENMRLEVVDQVGQVAKVLPRWMYSRQEDGEVLGFTPAWVIAYTIPGKSKLLQYNITEFFGTQLNLIDFEIDRYTLDANISTIKTTFDETPGPETIFDGAGTTFGTTSNDENNSYIKFPQVKIINNVQ